MTEPGDAAGDTLGIGELARRTGLTQQAIRAWEARFDFPVPARTHGGRRRYAAADVGRIQRVMALKGSGVRLAQAVARVRGEETTGPLSIYAALRDRHPHVESRVLRRAVLVAVSRAIEDETMSRASRPYVFGAFQRESFYRHAATRWKEIARTSAGCLVFADFPGSGGGAGSPVEVALQPGSPLLREWAVVVSSPTFSVVLTAWEPPHEESLAAEDRELESMLTFDPAAVRTAVGVCVAVARTSGSIPVRTLAAVDQALVAEPTSTHGVDALLLRAFDYLQRL